MEEEWRDMTVVSSAYEQQCEIHSGRWRHRRWVNASSGFGTSDGGTVRIGVGEWTPGVAPDSRSWGESV